jgi:hypothetical protein
MSGWDNLSYVIALLVSNLIAIGLLYTAWKYTRLSRFLMFLLFAWAGCFNWFTALTSPRDYINYADLAFLPFYKQFIAGWFSNHVLLMVGFIATAQLVIAASMLMKGWVYKAGCIGAIIFLLAILPLGVGAGFPFPILTAIAFYILYNKKHIDYLWVKHYPVIVHTKKRNPKATKLS